MAKKVYVIECRELVSPGQIDVTVAFVASSLSKAEELIKKNVDFSYADRWWWAVYPVLIDSEDVLDEIHFYDREGNKIDKQPV